MRRVSLFAALVLSSGCFNFSNDFDAYCARTGRCDGGVGAGGGSSGGGDAGGSAQGGGSGGGTAVGGGAQGGGTGGGSAAGGGTGVGGGGQALCGAVQCTNPINGVGFCDAGSCDIACNPTFHRCGFSCVDNNNAAACGPMCISCPNFGGLAMRACDAGVCDFTCINGYQRCGSQCLQANSAQACGSSCAVCTGGNGAQPFCDAGSCDFNCQNGFMKMNGQCIAPPVLTFPNISDVTDPNTFVDVKLDPRTMGTVWALDFSGQLLVSKDLGQTAFTVVCKVPGSGLNSNWTGFTQRTTTRIVLSHGADHTAYVVSPSNGSQYYGHVYRADMSSGLCTDVTPWGGSASYLWSTQFGSSFAVSGDGTIYTFDSDFNGSRLRRSADRGSSWTVLQDAGFLGTYLPGYLSGGPGPDLLLSIWQGGATSAQGLYLVTDGGMNVSRVSSGIYGQADIAVRSSWVYSGEAYVNRGSATTDGFLSTNGGVSWMQSAAYAASNDWALDPATNAGYRFAVYDGGINLERSNDMHTPAWARTNAFFANGGQGVQFDRLDAVGSEVAAVVDLRLYLSNDSGGTWRRVGTKPLVTTGGNVDSADGTNVYYVNTSTTPPYAFVAFASSDKGLTFAQRFSSTVNASGEQLTVRVNPLTAGNALAFANNPNSATYNTTMVVTHDGFVTADAGSNGANNWNSAFSFVPTAANQSYFYGSTTSFSSNSSDTYGTYAMSTLPSSPYYPFAQVTHDPNYALFMECDFTNKTYRINNSTHTAVDITAALSAQLGNDIPCSVEVYFTGTAWRLRGISKSGWMATSDDDGATWTAVSGANGAGLVACADRHIVSLPSDRNTVISWCATASSGRIWVSRNGGQSWTEPTAGANWTSYQCGLNSLAVGDTRLMAGCTQRPPVLIDY